MPCWEQQMASLIEHQQEADKEIRKRKIDLFNASGVLEIFSAIVLAANLPSNTSFPEGKLIKRKLNQHTNEILFKLNQIPHRFYPESYRLDNSKKDSVILYANLKDKMPLIKKTMSDCPIAAAGIIEDDCNNAGHLLLCLWAGDYSKNQPPLTISVDKIHSPEQTLPLVLQSLLDIKPKL